MPPPRSAFGAPPQGGAASGPAKRLRFSEGSHRASDVMPQLKPDPRRPLDRLVRASRAVLGAAERSQ